MIVGYMLCTSSPNFVLEKYRYLINIILFWNPSQHGQVVNAST
jgi:hypothetical protein